MGDIPCWRERRPAHSSRATSELELARHTTCLSIYKICVISRPFLSRGAIISERRDNRREEEVMTGRKASYSSGSLKSKMGDTIKANDFCFNFLFDQQNCYWRIK
ncbi:hypothetical protein AWENTII_008121 [Aspergillus wentii]